MSRHTPKQVYQDRINTLNRRKDFLVHRIRQNRLEGHMNRAGEQTYHYDRAELRALVWVLEVVNRHQEDAFNLIEIELARRQGEIV